jgi:hypothetical protein
LYADWAEKTSRFWTLPHPSKSPGSEEHEPRGGALRSGVRQMIDSTTLRPLFAANVDQWTCLWAVCSQCGPRRRECGPETARICSQCGRNGGLFVGQRDYVCGPLQVWHGVLRLYRGMLKLSTPPPLLNRLLSRRCQLDDCRLWRLSSPSFPRPALLHYPQASGIQPYGVRKMTSTARVPRRAPKSRRAGWP